MKMFYLIEILLSSFCIFLVTRGLLLYLNYTSVSLDWIISVLNIVPFIPTINYSININNLENILPVLLGIFTGILISKRIKKNRFICSLGRLHWDRNAFCRGWLITGSTGSGKTQCGINILMHQLFQNEKGKQNDQNETIEAPWGGLCIDEKGLYWQTLKEMAFHYNRSKDLVLLQTRPDYASEDWKPQYRLNLLSDDGIPSNTYASAIVNTAASISGNINDKGFFKTQSESQIGWAIELFRSIRSIQEEIRLPLQKRVQPSLKNILEVLTNREIYDDLVSPFALGESPENFKNVKFYECLSHFKNRYWNQPKDQLGGIQGTIYNYLNYFTNDDIAEVFCADNTFHFDEIEKGKIVCVAMPQKLQIERRYVCTLLKLLFYTQVLRRFDMEKSTFKKKNLLICWQDEAQRFITEADGNVDVIREAGATTIIACQSKTSLYPPLGGKEKANVTILNLRNRIIFRASDEDCAHSSAEFIGKEQKTKRTKSIGKSINYSYNKTDTYKVKPYQLRSLKDFCCVIYHSSGNFKRYRVVPKNPNGETPKWWYTTIPIYLRVILRLLPFNVQFLKQ